MLNWQGSGGFSVDASVRIEAEDRAGIERLVRYCARPPFALERLHALGSTPSLASPESRLIYRFPKPDIHGRTELLLTPLELLDALADQRSASVPSFRPRACIVTATTVCWPRMPGSGPTSWPSAGPSSCPRSQQPRAMSPHPAQPPSPPPLRPRPRGGHPREAWVAGPSCSLASTTCCRSSVPPGTARSVVR